MYKYIYITSQISNVYRHTSSVDHTQNGLYNLNYVKIGVLKYLVVVLSTTYTIFILNLNRSICLILSYLHFTFIYYNNYFN